MHIALNLPRPHLPLSPTTLAAVGHAVDSIYSPCALSDLLDSMQHTNNRPPIGQYLEGGEGWWLNTALMIDGQIAHFALVNHGNDQWVLWDIRQQVGSDELIPHMSIGYMTSRELFRVDLIQRMIPGTLGATVHAEMCVYRDLLKARIV